MGILFTKYKCTINFENLKKSLTIIQDQNKDLEFISGNSIPANLINHFIQSQEKVKNIIYASYKEVIESYTAESLQKLITDKPILLSKSFHIIVDTTLKEFAGRLDVTIFGKNARLETLFVDETYCKRRLGTWLIGAALLHLQNNNDVIEIEANTDESNEFALKTLRKYDFFHKYAIDNLLKK